MTTNLVGNITKGHKLLGYNKCFTSPVIKDVIEFANKAPPKQSPPTQNNPATETQRQGGPDFPSDPAVMDVNRSVSDDGGDDMPSGEDRNPIVADADIDASPRGQDHVEPSSSKCDSSSDPHNSTSGKPPTVVESEKMIMDIAVGEGESDSGASTAVNSYQIASKSNSGPAELQRSSNSNDTSDSIQPEEALANKPDKTPVGENLTPTEAAASSESNKNPVDEKEPDFDKPSGQDETEESIQSDESDIVCGQGEAPPTTTSTPTTSTSSGFNDSPTDTKSDVAMSCMPTESDGDGACVDDSAAALDVGKTIMTSTESTTTSSQPSGGTALCDAPCVDTPVDSTSEACSVNTRDECHSESIDSCPGSSLTAQDTCTVAVTDSIVSSNGCTAIPHTDIKPDNDHQAAETVDAHNGSESDVCGCPDEKVVLAGAELHVACQSDKQEATLKSHGSSVVNSPAITEAERKADDNSSSINLSANMGSNVVFSETTTEVNTCCEADCLPFVPHEDTEANSSNVVPSSGKYKASCIETVNL